MANEQNLIPTNKRSKSEVRKNSRKGGIASGEARRRKRDIRMAIDTLLEKTYKGKGGEELSGAEAIAIKQMERALKGDTRAFEVVRDTAGQKPVDRVEVAQIDKAKSMKELQDLFDDE